MESHSGGEVRGVDLQVSVGDVDFGEGVCEACSGGRRGEEPLPCGDVMRDWRPLV